MSRKLKINVFIFFLLITPMIIFYKYDTNKKAKITELLSAEYPSIKLNEQITGTVSRIDHPYPELFKNHPHQAEVLLNDSIKKSIRTSYELTHGRLMLDDILNVGDQLIKEPGSDTLFIIKVNGNDTLKYRFTLRDPLGYPLKEK